MRIVFISAGGTWENEMPVVPNAGEIVVVQKQTWSVQQKDFVPNGTERLRVIEREWTEGPEEQWSVVLKVEPDA